MDAIEIHDTISLQVIQYIKFQTPIICICCNNRDFGNSNISINNNSLGDQKNINKNDRISNNERDVLQPHIYVITKGDQLHVLRMTSFVNQVKDLVDTPAGFTGDPLLNPHMNYINALNLCSIIDKNYLVNIDISNIHLKYGLSLYENFEFQEAIFQFIAAGVRAMHIYV
jgi:hypothetical protein